MQGDGSDYTSNNEVKHGEYRGVECVQYLERKDEQKQSRHLRPKHPRDDRTKLLLVFAARHEDATADALESRTARSNKIRAGSSATGMVSDITRAAGCTFLLFPAAASMPLLVACLVFGEGARVVQSGDEAARYFSEPNRLTDKMVALHRMVPSLLRITEVVLKHGLLRTHLDVNYSLDGLSEGGGDESKQRGETSQHVALAREMNEQAGLGRWQHKRRSCNDRWRRWQYGLGRLYHDFIGRWH